jgi:hypothetical protein
VLATLAVLVILAAYVLVMALVDFSVNRCGSFFKKYHPAAAASKKKAKKTQDNLDYAANLPWE